MNLVDSSGWLSYLADEPAADFFAPAIEDTTNLLVSTINLFEVFKKVHTHRGEAAALECMALMKQGKIIAVDEQIAIHAAEFSATKGLPMADSLIWITAQHHQATLWTQDNDFRGLPSVRFPA